MKNPPIFKTHRPHIPFLLERIVSEALGLGGIQLFGEGCAEGDSCETGDDDDHYYGCRCEFGHFYSVFSLVD